MTEQEALNRFGELLIRQARDVALGHFEKTISGEMRNPEAIDLHEQIRALPIEALGVMRRTVVRTIDETLHYLLWIFEQHEDVRLRVMDQEREIDLAEASDGLAGELYTDDGWIQRFSHYHSSEPSDG